MVVAADAPRREGLEVEAGAPVDAAPPPPQEAEGIVASVEELAETGAPRPPRLAAAASPARLAGRSHAHPPPPPPPLVADDTEAVKHQKRDLVRVERCKVEKSVFWRFG